MKSALATGVALALRTSELGARFANSTSTARGQRVIVIGAGLAGLTAAYELMRAGQEVTVLEARGHPGGRVRTLRDDFTDGLYAEAGAIDFSDNYTLLRRYLSAFGLQAAAAPVAPRTAVYFRGHRYLTPPDPASNFQITENERAQGFGGVWNSLVREESLKLGDPMHPNWASALAQELETKTLNDYLRGRGVSADVVDWFSTRVYGADFSHLSALASMMTERIYADWRDTLSIAGGNDQLPHAFARALGTRIRYGAAVEGLSQSGSKARVSFRRGSSRSEMDADHVVVAIPFSVLRTVKLDSSFSGMKRNVIERMKYDSCVRVYVQTSARVWSQEGVSGDASTDLPIGSVVEHTAGQPGPRGILEAQMVHNKAEVARAVRPEERVRWVTAWLEKVHPGISDTVEGGTCVSWDQDPWSRGSWAEFEPGEMTRFVPQAAASEGRIHFAGEHTSAMCGTMEGAIESGLRAASEITLLQIGATFVHASKAALAT